MNFCKLGYTAWLMAGVSLQAETHLPERQVWKTTQAAAGLQVGENAAFNTVELIPAVLATTLAAVLHLQYENLFKVSATPDFKPPVILNSYWHGQLFLALNPNPGGWGHI